MTNSNLASINGYTYFSMLHNGMRLNIAETDRNEFSVWHTGKGFSDFIDTIQLTGADDENLFDMVIDLFNV